MAVTLSVRAGAQHVSRYIYWLPDKAGVVDTTGSKAQIEIRDARAHQRVILMSKEWQMPPEDLDGSSTGTDPAFLHLVDVEAVIDATLDEVFAAAPPGTPLIRVYPGMWVLRLGRTVTKTLPPVSRFEIELVNDLDSEDVTPLVSGVIRITPEVVTSVVSAGP